MKNDEYDEKYSILLKMIKKRSYAPNVVYEFFASMMVDKIRKSN